MTGWRLISGHGVAPPVGHGRSGHSSAMIEYAAVSRGRPGSVETTDVQAGGCAGCPRTSHAEPLDGGAAALVAGVGADRHPEHAPHLERVGEQEQLGLGVDRRSVGRRPPATCRRSPPRRACRGPATTATLRKRVQPTRSSVGEAPLHERHGGVALRVGEQPGDVALHRRRRSAGTGVKPYVASVAVGRGDERGGVVDGERFEAHVRAGEGESVRAAWAHSFALRSAAMRVVSCTSFGPIDQLVARRAAVAAARRRAGAHRGHGVRGELRRRTHRAGPVPAQAGRCRSCPAARSPVSSPRSGPT